MVWQTYHNSKPIFNSSRLSFTDRNGKTLQKVSLGVRQTFLFIHAGIKNKLSMKIGFGELKRSLLFTFAKFGQVGFGSGLYLQYDWLMGF